MFRQPSSRLGLLLNMNKKIGYAVPFASYSHKNGRLECYGLEEFLRILRIPVHSRVSNLATSRRRTLSETASETNPISRQKERVSRPPLPLHSPPHLGNGSRFLPVAFLLPALPLSTHSTLHHSGMCTDFFASHLSNIFLTSKPFS